MWWLILATALSLFLFVLSVYIIVGVSVSNALGGAPSKRDIISSLFLIIVSSIALPLSLIALTGRL
jgi:hypothetical protein